MFLTMSILAFSGLREFQSQSDLQVTQEDQTQQEQMLSVDFAFVGGVQFILQSQLFLISEILCIPELVSLFSTDVPGPAPNLKISKVLFRAIISPNAP